ncbi:MAG: hypothetical protein ACLR7U_14950 [Ruthenibacterium lactatiformans]
MSVQSLDGARRLVALGLRVILARELTLSEIAGSLRAAELRPRPRPRALCMSVRASAI